MAFLAISSSPVSLTSAVDPLDIDPQGRVGRLGRQRARRLGRLLREAAQDPVDRRRHRRRVAGQQAASAAGFRGPVVSQARDAAARSPPPGRPTPGGPPRPPPTARRASSFCASRSCRPTVDRPAGDRRRLARAAESACGVRAAERPRSDGRDRLPSRRRRRECPRSPASRRATAPTWSRQARQDRSGRGVTGALPDRTADRTSSAACSARAMAAKSTMPAAPFSVWKARKALSRRSLSSGRSSSASRSSSPARRARAHSIRNCSTNSFMPAARTASRRARPASPG